MSKLTRIEVELHYLDHLKLYRIVKALRRKGRMVEIQDLVNEGIRYVIQYYSKTLKFEDLYPELFPQ